MGTDRQISKKNNIYVDGKKEKKKTTTENYLVKTTASYSIK